MRSTPKLILVFLGLLVLFLVFLPTFSGPFYMELVTRMMIWGIFALSLDLLVGYTGLISLGHAAFFGMGAYVLGGVFKDASSISFWLAFPLSLLGSALAALVIGWFSIRTTGIFFIMITLAFAQMFFFYAFQSSYLGGDDGIFLFSRPEIYLGDFQLINLENEHVLYYFVFFWLLFTYALLTLIIHSPFGQVIKGICANENRVRALGYEVQRYKLVSFVIAGTLGGLAGFLDAVQTGYVNPSLFYWHESGIVLVIVILGGMGTLYGPVIGAFLMILLENFLPEFYEHWQLLMGLIIIGVVLFLPNGLVGLFQLLHERLTSTKEAQA